MCAISGEKETSTQKKRALYEYHRMHGVVHYYVKYDKLHAQFCVLYKIHGS